MRPIELGAFSQANGTSTNRAVHSPNQADGAGTAGLRAHGKTYNVRTNQNHAPTADSAKANPDQAMNPTKPKARAPACLHALDQADSSKVHLDETLLHASGYNGAHIIKRQHAAKGALAFGCVYRLKGACQHDNVQRLTGA